MKEENLDMKENLLDIMLSLEPESSVKDFVQAIETPVEYKKRDWTDEEKQFLKENYSELSLVRLEKELDRSASSIKSMALKMRLRKKDKVWTNEKVYFLVANYAKMSWYDLQNELDMPKSTIESKAYSLKLKKDKNTCLRSNKFSSINLVYNEETVCSLAMTANSECVLDLIKSHLHHIRPALLRGGKIFFQLS